ncbi:MAG TPA: hypothetical protein VGU90_13355, partial [Terriglobales bacterium]|nr:hypothetical protein [Terriglobales bacterium]
MSKLRKIAASISAAAALVLGCFMTIQPAHAATPSCGTSCIEPFSHEWGKRLVMDAIHGGVGVQHQKVILFRASHDDAAEDFTFSVQGTVPSLVADGLLPTVDLLHYSADNAFEVEYSPNGVDSNLCVGTWSTHPVATNLLRLEPCGEAANTIWIVD